MPELISIPDPAAAEQRRLVAQSIADLHHAVGIIVENAPYFLPGESHEELRQAWARSSKNFEEAAKQVLLDAGSGPAAKLNEESLHAHELLEKPGQAKRALLARLKDRFLSAWSTEPKTEQRVRHAMVAAVELLDFGSTYVGSVPVLGGPATEILQLVKQSVGIALRQLGTSDKDQQTTHVQRADANESTSRRQ